MVLPLYLFTKQYRFDDILDHTSKDLEAIVIWLQTASYTRTRCRSTIVSQSTIFGPEPQSFANISKQQCLLTTPRSSSRPRCSHNHSYPPTSGNPKPKPSAHTFLRCVRTITPSALCLRQEETGSNSMVARKFEQQICRVRKHIPALAYVWQPASTRGVDQSCAKL